MGDDAAGCVGWEGGQRGDSGELHGAIRIVLPALIVLVEAQDEHEVYLESIIDGVEDARKWNIADQWNLEARE